MSLVCMFRGGTIRQHRASMLRRLSSDPEGMLSTAYELAC